MSDDTASLPSTLLRLCVLCASSLQALDATQAPQETVDDQVAKQSGAQLSAQIAGDLLALFRKTSKDTTALSLAMRPPATHAEDTDAPLNGLDAQSIKAATHLLNVLASDTVPKMAFLANLAQKNQAVYTLTDAAANDESLAAARKMGARVVYGDQAKGGKAVAASVGALFAREVCHAVVDVIELVAQLCQSFMDARTRTVLERAQQRRDGETSAATRFPEPTRGASLALTKRLWTLCDGLAGDGSAAHIARMPRNNKEALAKLWKQAYIVLEDGRSELREAIEGDVEEEDAENEDDLGAQWSQSVSLSGQERATAEAVLALLEQGAKFEKEMRGALLSESTSTVDFDAVGEAVTTLSEAQDELVSLVLYGADDEDENSSDALEETTGAYLHACHELASAAEVAPATLPQLDEHQRSVLAVSI